MTDNMFLIGKIVNTHGIRGEVRVEQITDFSERFAVGNQVYIVPKNQPPIPVTIASHRLHKQYHLLRFEGFDHIDDVEPFKQADLKITEADLSDLPEGEYYYHEIIGCQMYTTNEEYIGVVVDIFPTGANDVWVIERENGKEALIPYIQEVVKEIDLSTKKIYIELMEGLLD